MITPELLLEIIRQMAEDSYDGSGDLPPVWHSVHADPGPDYEIALDGTISCRVLAERLNAALKA